MKESTESNISIRRISRGELFMGSAYLAAQRGTCQRAKVGAVIIKNRRIVSLGYNGSLPGKPHCDEESCTAGKPCPNSVHAEANAIAFAARDGISIEGTTIYCTLQPCIKCAELIIQSGINHVVYSRPYRCADGLELLRSCGIVVEQLALEIDINIIKLHDY